MKKLLFTVSCLALTLFTNNVRAAVLYWDPEGVTTQTTGNLAGTWDTTTAQWSPISAQTNALIVWNTGDAACFCAQTGTAATGAFTVSVNSAISCAGLFNGALNPAGYNVTMGGTGSINFISGNDALDTSGSDGDPMIINIPITGPGTAVFEGVNQLYLKASNSYTGGTLMGYFQNPFGNIVNFTNGSFGSGPIIFSNCSGAAMVVLGQAPVTIPNAVTNLETNVTFNMNIVANTAGVNFSGPWNFSGATDTAPSSLGSGGGVTNLLILSGIISGTNGFNKFNPGMLALTGNSNSYGTNTVHGSTTVSNGYLIAANTSGSATGIFPVVILTGSSGTGTLTGSGTISGSVANNGNISATNMSGGCATLTTGSETWAANSTNIFAIKSATGTSGTAWNQIQVNGSLTLDPTSKFTINVVSLTSANKQGAMAAFDNTQNYSWPILTASGGIVNFSTNNITILTSAFANGLGLGKFNVTTNNNTIYLNFGPPPTVSLNPVFSVAVGGTAHINAATTGTSLTYQWTLNGGPLNGADIVGSQTSSNLTIHPVSLADGGVYDVTVSSVAGSASAETGMVVVASPSYTGTPGNETVTLNFSGPSYGSLHNPGYRVWSSPTLDPAFQPVELYWNIVSFGNQFGPGTNTITDSGDQSANSAIQFYCITVP